MEEWKEYKLGEFASFKTGKLNSNAAVENGCYPFFTCSPETLRINDYAFDQKAILLAGNNAEGNFNIKYYEGKFNAYQRTYVINPVDERLDIKFLYYALSICLQSFKRISQGTSTKFLTAQILNNFILNVPSLPTQQKIANILSSLDDKIEMNRRINEQLEGLAQALFKSWFVDFEPFKDGEFVESELGMIPEWWRVGKLGEVADVIMGSSPAGSSYNTEGNGTIFYQGRTDFGFRFPNVRMFTTEPKRFAESNSVLLSVRAPVGDVNIAFEKCCIGRGLASIKSNCYADSFTYYLLKSLKPVLDNYNNEGTVFGCINKDALNNLTILVPTIEKIKEFEKIVSSFDAEIRRRSEEITHLTNLRDTLLPKLMSGEIDVNNNVIQ